MKEEHSAKRYAFSEVWLEITRELGCWNYAERLRSVKPVNPNPASRVIE